MKSLSNKKIAILVSLFMAFSIVLAGCSGGNAKKTGEAKKVNFPERPITLVCWSAPGAPLDIFARNFAQIMEKHAGQQVVVENKEGGGGGVAMSAIQAKAADGYTLLAGTRAGAALLAGGQIKLTPDNFDFLLRANAETSSIAVKAGRFKDIEEFIKYGKENPGKLKVGGVGTGTFHHSVLVAIEEKTGAKFTWVPYEGGNLAVASILGGQIDAAMMTPSSGKGQIEAGELKILAISDGKRSAFYPDVPTLKEKGIDVDEALWRGIYAKSGIPQETLEALDKIFEKTMKDPQWTEYLKKFDQEDAFLPRDKFNVLARKEIQEYTKFLEKIGMLKK